MNDIADKLRSLRGVKGLSRAKVARELGVHDHTLRSWEAGDHDIPLQKALTLCSYYGITIAELVGEETVQDLSRITDMLKVLEVEVEALRRRTENP